MPRTPWYDSYKSYEDNFAEGPSGDFGRALTTHQYIDVSGQYEFFGKPLRFPFGIPAGPLLNSAYVIAALDSGFDIPVYKTVRTKAYACHPWPNVLPVDVEGDLTFEKASRGLVTDNAYQEPLSITNSFGVPSKDPSYWQEDMEKAVRHAGEGQHVVGSFQGTKWPDTDYSDDWVLAAKLVSETGVSAIEANFSCPNEGDAHLLCFDAPKVRTITERIKKTVGDTPLIAKVAYFPARRSLGAGGEEEPLRDFVKTVGGIVDGISAINTIPAEVRTPEGEQALPGEGRLRSGVCGASIKWAGLSMVKRLKALREEYNFSYTIIGVGGVMKPKDFFEYRSAGADVVMSATGAMWNGNLAQEIKSKA